MTSIQHKSFLLGKYNESNGRQDALAVNDSLSMYAVADGVSNSFRPDIVARTLCKIFTEQNCEIFSQWRIFCQETLLPKVKETWELETKSYLNTLTGRLLRHETYNYEKWHMGASTFCGIHIDLDKHRLSYAIIGDSTLFVNYQDGKYEEYNSIPKSINENGKEITEYSNITSAILSNNSISGEWLTGELPLNGINFVALMTDGMSKWFQTRCINGETPFNILWEISDMEEFINLATEARNTYEMDDDLAVITIKINHQENYTSKIPTEIAKEREFFSIFPYIKWSFNQTKRLYMNWKSFIFPYTKWRAIEKKQKIEESNNIKAINTTDTKTTSIIQSDIPEDKGLMVYDKDHALSKNETTESIAELEDSLKTDNSEIRQEKTPFQEINKSII